MFKDYQIMNEINVTHLNPLCIGTDTLPAHKCAGKCPEFKGEQCNHCLVPDSSEIPNKLESIGDDAHIENHVSPLCRVDGKTALNNMESCYIEKKKHAELLETEVARLNSIIERQKSEMVAMQVEIDLLTQAKKTEQAITQELDSIYLVDEYQPIALFISDEVQS